MAKKAATSKGESPVDMAGYRRRPVYAWREFTQIDEGEDEAVGEPLRVKVQTNLSLGEKEDIRFDADATFSEVFESIAPYVVAWNVEARDADGAMIKLPPPVEAGPDILRALDEVEAIWLLSVVKQGRSYGVSPADEKKDLTTPEPTDAP